MHSVVQEVEASDAMMYAGELYARAGVQAQSDATVAEAMAESQGAANTIAAEDTVWQADERSAVLSQAAHDIGNSASIVADANTSQAAESAWEHTEAVSARDDQVAVAQANDQSEDAGADATRAGNDSVAQAILVGANAVAAAAQTRDSQVAAAHYAMVYAEAAAVDNAVHTGAAEARQGVITNSSAAAAQVPQAAIIIAANLAANNATTLSQEIANHDAALDALLTRVTANGNAQITVAQQKLTADQAAPVTQFVTINPRIPQSAIQILNDYTPDWQTVVMVGAIAIVGVTVSVLVPGVGPVLTALLLSRFVGAGVDRYFDQNQTLAEVWVGAQADALGITQIYAGITNRDIATNEHLGLTVQQQRRIIGEEVLQGTVTLVTMGATRFAASRRPVAPRPRGAGGGGARGGAGGGGAGGGGGARGGAAGGGGAGARPAGAAPVPPAPPNTPQPARTANGRRTAPRSNAQLIQDVATRAERRIGGTGRVAGTDKHTYAKRLLDRYQRMYGNRGLETEQSWIAHGRAGYGQRGSVRIDVWDSNANIAYDYKFTRTPPIMTPAQRRRIVANGPRGLTPSTVIEVNP